MNSKLLTAVSIVGLLAMSVAPSSAQQHYRHNGQGWGGYTGYGGNGGNNGSFHSLVGQDNHISQQEQYIDNRLQQGNLTSTQQANLQSHLTQLQSQQSTINSQLGTDLSNRQTQLQNQLSSGNLSQAQQANIQNRLNHIQGEESSLTSGTNPFAGQGNGYGNHGNWGSGGNNNYGGNGYQGTNLNGAGGYPGVAGNGMHQLVRQDDHLSSEEQWIQGRLSQGNLSSSQQASLQSRLTQLQSQQAGLNGQLGTDLTGKQSYLQNLLNSGTLSSQQQAGVQSRLQQLQNEQNAINSGQNPFYH